MFILNMVSRSIGSYNMKHLCGHNGATTVGLVLGSDHTCKPYSVLFGLSWQEEESEVEEEEMQPTTYEVEEHSVTATFHRMNIK